MEGRVIPFPLAYPELKARRHGPFGWRDYRRYLEWLRDEFSFRCVYCLMREQWVDRRRSFQIDHLEPQKTRPDLKSEYTNLLYLCSSCNNLKGARGLPDPFTIPLGHCLRFHIDGNVEALRPEGEQIIETLALDRSDLIDFRLRKIGGILSDAESDWGRFVQEMRFPNELPDLTLDPPPHNSRAEGVAESWFAKRQRGELPEVY